MGAIQSAINQGLATAGILYSQSDLAEQRKKDFADKRELKDIDKQLKELGGTRETLQKQVEGLSKVAETTPHNTLEEKLAYFNKKEKAVENMQAGMDLYQGMATDLSKRRFELTKDPRDLQRAQFQLAGKRLSQSSYDELKAKIAQARTLAQQKMAKSIKPRNFYKELREMELNDEQQ